MQDKWQALVEQFSLVKDKLGKSIDTEIFETVVALNALGIPTTMSCGGHIDDGRGLLLPWVDIGSSNPHLVEMQKEQTRLVKEAEMVHQKVTQLRNEKADEAQIKIAQKQADETYSSLHHVQWQIRVSQSEVRTCLAQYLAQFYQDRLVPFDRRLVLEGTSRIRLHSQGALDFYLTAPEDVQRRKLVEYREEIAAFTAFLKDIYFSKQLALA